ncbi:hypothetical protein FCV43_03270 [Vibrio genomosp. F6]|uniref:hypothetical protein n=1 Tax=Vibrio genomosp. F6 TaxID=723172 RepID=UPI0010BD437D|nr:hypothetical protein [Vibrio genomosp. F6]TKF23444.1 hypothetical protein FCV43_03270 [Vibrio genomosp. F6]
MPFALVLSLYIAKDKVIFSKIVDVWSVISLVACGFAIFAFLYSFMGYPELATFPNPNGKINVIFPGSFTNFRLANGIMRPSFIYDEPGAFSFFLTVVAVCRVILGKGRKVTTTILTLGLITFSLMHVLVLGIYVLFSLKFNYKSVLSLIGITSFVLCLIIISFDKPEFAFFYERFNFSNGTFAGDNRSGQISNFLDAVNTRIVLFGDYYCHGPAVYSCSQHGDISSSPVTPLYKGGVIWLIFQIFCHLVLFLFSFGCRKRFMVFLILTLCLFQRPFFTDLGYQILIFIPVFYMLLKLGFLNENKSIDYYN